MKKKEWIFGFIVFIAVYLSVMFTNAITVCAIDSNAAINTINTETVDVKSYEFDMGNDYNFSSGTEVSEMSFGKKQLGSLSISGNITDKGQYRGKTAYGTGNDSTVSFSYSYDGSLQTGNKEDWNLRTDSGTIVDEFNLNASIDKGVLLIQTSTDGYTWTNVVNPITNFYATNTTGKENFYTTEGMDVVHGKFYRVILAYKTGRKTGTTGSLWWKEDVYQDKRHVELYEFYLVINSDTISIHNLATDETALPEIEGVTKELVKRGETLIDGSMTTKGFSIDKLNSSYVVKVAKDGSDSVSVEDGAKFTENGKYTIQTITKLGKQIVKTVYVFNGGEDLGYSVYFGDSIVQGKRIFREGNYPTYARGAYIQIKDIAENIPILRGSITNRDIGNTIDIAPDRAAQKYPLEVGSYCVDFYSGEDEVGSVYHYKAYFNVLNEDPKPYVNYTNLMKADRLSDLSSKHYEVAYQTTAGGYIFVCFALESYDEAFKYAYEIEKRFVESAEDGWVYYKLKDNPNQKVKYLKQGTELTEALNYYARKNVEHNYFNPIDEFTYRTCESGSVEELETLSIRESIKVFPTQEEKDKLFDRKPFLNNFKFIQVADYDVVSVEAYCHKNSRSSVIEFNRDVSLQLSVSSKYTITETSVYGDTRVYDAYYLNENQTKSSWLVSYNGTDTIIEVSDSMLENNKVEITADTIAISSIENKFDDNAIVTIKAPGVYTFEIKCLISELKDVGLYKKGQYKLTFVDRTGNNYQLIINITGNSRYSDVVKSNVRSYTNLYSAVYLNAKPEDEEIIFDVTELKAKIDRPVDQNLYTANSYAQYVEQLKAAQAVYNNQNSNQAQINVAALSLEKAYLRLIKTADKTQLYEELDKFLSIDRSRYITASYNNYKSAYYSGLQVYENEQSTQNDVIAAVQTLKNAYGALSVRGDKTTLYVKLQEMKAIDCSLYTPSTIEALNKTYYDALLVFNNLDATQSQIDETISILNSKKSALRFIADFSELYAAIQQTKGIDKNLYTVETVVVLKIKYDEAVAVYKNRNSSQYIVNSAKNALLQAKNKLVGCGDDTALIATMTEIFQLPHVIYTKESIELLLAKYNAAAEMLNGRFPQAELDDMVTALIKLKNSLEIRQDKQDLYNVLTEMANMDLSKYSKNKQGAFIVAYNAALQTLNSADSTKEQTLLAKQSVEKAKIDLQEKRDGSPWWVILIICVVSIALMVIAHLIILFWVDVLEPAWLWMMWGISVAALVALVFVAIFTSFPWWGISLIELGAIVGSSVLTGILDEVTY